MSAARSGAAVWSVVAGIASVATMPLAVYLTRFVASYELRDVWLGVPVAGGLGVAAIVLARRASRRSALRLGGGGGSSLARTGRVLGIVGVCMASATVVAFAVLGLLEYAGSRN